MKKCSVCNEIKPIEDFSFIKARGKHMSYCKSCNNKKFRKYRQSKKSKKYRKEYQSTDKYKEMLRQYRQTEEGKERHRQNAQSYREKAKTEVISHYSNNEMKCCKCGLDDIRALTIDHIDGGGTEHRRRLQISSGAQFYAWLRRNGFPEGYQVLCMNCQFIKRHENREYDTRDCYTKHLPNT